MATITVDALERTYQKTIIWLKELAELGHLANEVQAYSALRAVLHSLRDRLTVDEAAHLAAQLPMLVRGMYYEGWKPSEVPHKERDRSAFIESVREHMGPTANPDFAPAHAIEAVFSLLDEKITQGEISDIKQMLPPEIRDLWPK